MGDEQQLTTVAAVDLGSNSFHMVVADSVHGQLRVLDRLRERVALAEGLDAELTLGGEPLARSLECLARFGQRLRGLAPRAVRVVGTSTLRRARNARSVLAQCRRALGFQVEVLSGNEEARLIYMGVAHGRALADERRLVLDIGGGSTEVILGEGLNVLQTDSLAMGCVSWSRRHFADGSLTREAMRAARLDAEGELQGLLVRARRLGWSVTLGASGTCQAIAEILRASGWSDGAITREGLKSLRRALYAARRTDALDLAGLADERRGVIAGGVAIASALFSSLELERAEPATGALREGVLFDLLGRMAHSDLREQTLARFQASWHVDAEQAARVEATARALFEQLAGAWSLDELEHGQMLLWAARLHEIGLGLAYSGHHKHGAYIVAHADMPGFSREDQQLLAALIVAQRRKLSREPFDALGEERAGAALRLALILRLAVLLNRGRGPQPTPVPVAEQSTQGLELAFPEQWLERHPLSQADLRSEARSWGDLGLALAAR